MDKKVTITCPCLFGLESVLSFEVKKLGGENITVSDGRVTFEGNLAMVAKANIWLRTAERVGIVIGKFRAETFTELFDGTAALPWEDFIGVDDQFPVKGWSRNSKLFSMSDCQSIIKRAIVRRFENVYHKEIFAETGAIYQVQFSILKDTVTLLLDTTARGSTSAATAPTRTRRPSRRRSRPASSTSRGCGGIPSSTTRCAAPAPS